LGVGVKDHPAHAKLKEGKEKTFEDERIPKWMRIDVFNF
jgi:hypothetical protein